MHNTYIHTCAPRTRTPRVLTQLLTYAMRASQSLGEVEDAQLRRGDVCHGHAIKADGSHDIAMELSYGTSRRAETLP